MSRHKEDPLPLTSEFADDQEMAELIDLFVAEMPVRVRALQAAFEQTSLEDLQQMAHQLKGAAPFYGFPEISAAAAELELAAQRDVRIEELKTQLEELINLCRRAGPA